MLGNHALGAFVASTDLKRAREFYAGTLGLSVTGEDGFALILDAHGTILRVSKVETITPHPYTVLGWVVPDIHGMIAELTKRGVAFERYTFFQQDELGVWISPDKTLVAWFKDPDGNFLSLSQHGT